MISNLFQDAPPYFNAPPYTEKSPSAAGLVQLSSCQSANIAGVTCTPTNHMLFASGMNGDEDLGMDIKMKGEKYHIAQKQWVPVVVNTPYDKLPYCTGTNGPTDVNCRPDKCSGTNGPMDGPAGSPCVRDAPTQGRPYETTGDLTRTYVPASSSVQILKQ
jgi:hypothetical protein